MRLTAQQRRVIRRAALDCFGPEARVTLFGSRADDTARGGDIDLLVDYPGRGEHPPIFAIAERTGVRL